MRKIRVGLVGAGFVAAIHMEAFSRVTGFQVEVIAVASKSSETGQAFARKHGIAMTFTDYRHLLDNSDIDIVDICTPNILHRQVCIDAAQAGKHIICEKPLTGYFGEGSEHFGNRVGRSDRLDMYRQAMRAADEIVGAAERNRVKLCYAEDFVYAPAVAKAKRLVAASGGSILEMRSEESHSGSHAAYSRHWRLAGGGSLLRLGSHPLGLVLHLKAFEGRLKAGKPIGVKTITADMGEITKTDAFRDSPGCWIVDKWDDVEDWASVILTFEDGTKAVVSANDITLGGIVNTLEIRTTNSVVKCNMASNDSVRAYAPSSHVFADEYISEKIETKSGWSFPSPDEDWMRGYPQEMQDFIEAVYYDRQPISDGELGRRVVQAVYAAYLSAEQGRRIDLAELSSG